MNEQRIKELKQLITNKTCQWQYHACAERQTTEDYNAMKAIDKELDVLYEELYKLDPAAEHNWNWYDPID